MSSSFLGNSVADLSSLLLCGGGSRNKVLAQGFADVFGLPAQVKADASNMCAKGGIRRAVYGLVDSSVKDEKAPVNRLEPVDFVAMGLDGAEAGAIFEPDMQKTKRMREEFLPAFEKLEKSWQVEHNRRG